MTRIINKTDELVEYLSEPRRVKAIVVAGEDGKNKEMFLVGSGVVATPYAFLVALAVGWVAPVENDGVTRYVAAAG